MEDAINRIAGTRTSIERSGNPEAATAGHGFQPAAGGSPLQVDETLKKQEALSPLIPRSDAPLLTPAEVAEDLRVSAEHVRCLIRSGELSAIDISTGSKRPLYRIRREALAEFLTQEEQPSQPKIPRRSIRRPPVPDLFPDVR